MSKFLKPNVNSVNIIDYPCQQLEPDIRAEILHNLNELDTSTQV